MKKIVTLVIICVFISVKASLNNTKNVFCYYDSRSFFRSGIGKVYLHNIEPALSQCTHLIYGFATICSKDFTLTPLNRDLDIGKYDYYTKVTNLKKSYPHLKVILSVGGGAERKHPKGYLDILDFTQAKKKFINSTISTLMKYGFDGIDLAWQFPPDKPIEKKGFLGTLWRELKSYIISEKPVDEHHEFHSNQFDAMVEKLATELRQRNLLTIVSVLPNVNSKMFFKTRSILNVVDFVILHAYDIRTPGRYPKQADIANPLYNIDERFDEMNVEDIIINWWNVFSSTKLILGIPTYGQAWKIESESDCTFNGKPPMSANGAAPKGPLSDVGGILGYFEICSFLIEDKVTEERYLKRIYDKKLLIGPYAFRGTFEGSDFGVWISYEDPEDIDKKIDFIKYSNMGGVAIVNIALDDYIGVCNGEKFPLLNAAVKRLRS